MAHQAITSTISTCLSINPCLGLQHELLSDKLLESPNGRVDSPPLKISVDASSVMNQPQSFETKPQVDSWRDIAKAMFPNAPEKTKNVDCFR
jgi:hypothetical protein